MSNLIGIIELIALVFFGSSLIAFYLAWKAKKEGELRNIVEMIDPVELEKRAVGVVLFSSDSEDFAQHECDAIRYAWFTEMNAVMDEAASLRERTDTRVLRVQ